MKNFLKFPLILVIVQILLLSCSDSTILPSDNVSYVKEGLTKFDNSHIDDGIDEYAKSLGFRVSKFTDATKGIHLTSKSDAKRFLAGVKNGNKNKELDELFIKIYGKNYKKSPFSLDPSSKEAVILKDRIKPNLMTGPGPCQNWNNSHYGSTSFGFGLLNFGINLTNGLPASVNTWLSGITLGIGWTQTWVETPVRQNDVVTIIIHGTEDYVLFIEGIGKIFSTDVTYRVYINCNGSVTLDRIYQ